VTRDGQHEPASAGIEFEMGRLSDTMNLHAESRCFSDVFLHSQAIVNWSQHYDQISPGIATTTLRQVAGQRFHVFRERINQRVMQHGLAPRGRLCFALPIANTAAPIVQGRTVARPSLPRAARRRRVRRASSVRHRSARLHDRPHAHGRSRARRTGEPARARPPATGAADLAGALPHGAGRLERVLCQALDHGSLTARDAFDERVLAHNVVGILLDLVQSDEADAGAAVGVDAKLHRAAQPEIALECDDVPTVIDLCHHLRISRRTLQYSFQNVVGTTPTAYLRSIRLNAVRRFLMTTPETMRIGDAAAQFGFCHFGRFSAYYQQHFHELPSHTPRLS
jgi:AraC-like DNA-binding protein